MNIEEWTWENVKPDGTFIHELGAVNVEKGITFSMPHKGGCGNPVCHCSDGYWMCVSFGYNAEEMSVKGITVRFDDKEEFDKYFGFNFN